MDNFKLDAFLNITQKLNELGIIPLLMGSLGLEQVTNRSWLPSDNRYTCCGRS